MIYFINESAMSARGYVVESHLRGYEARAFEDADDAFDHLLTADDVEMILVSTALPVRQKDDPRGTHFDAQSDAEKMRYGHALIRLLHHRRPDLFPGKVVIFDSALNEEAVQENHKLARELGIKYIPKEAILSYGEIFVHHVHGINRRLMASASNAGATRQDAGLDFPAP